MGKYAQDWLGLKMYINLHSNIPSISPIEQVAPNCYIEFGVRA
jgi:hypothetical protein